MSDFFTTCKRKHDTYWGEDLQDSRQYGHAITRRPLMRIRRNSHPHQHRRTRLGFRGSLVSGGVGVVAGLRRRVIVGVFGPGLGHITEATPRAAGVALGGRTHGRDKRLHSDAAFGAVGWICHAAFLYIIAGRAHARWNLAHAASFFPVSGSRHNIAIGLNPSSTHCFSRISAAPNVSRSCPIKT